MLKLKPSPDNPFVCPICRREQPRINEFRFESVNVFADCICAKCSFEFLQVLPIGHTVNYPISIGKRTDVIYWPEKCPEWLSQAFSQARKDEHDREVPIERIIYKNCRSVVILNALDFLYGHVLLKLYNSFYHLNQQGNIGLVVIIPKIFKWLIPKGCAEAWVVDLTLGELKHRYGSMQKFVTGQMDRFQEVFISRAYSHPDFSGVNIARLTGVTPFDLNNFSHLKPTITFVLREDRWWFTNVVDFWIYKMFRKLKRLTLGGRMLTLNQNRQVKKTMRLIKKEFPQVNFFVTGLGKTGHFAGYAQDQRYRKIDDAIEKNWCEIYAKSHVVVGVHGSNMLLPTALAAGCVEILPEDRYGNIVQDISVRYSDRKQLFFYRFADQYARPESVAAKTTAILRDYELFDRNMSRNTYPRTDNDRFDSV